MRKPVLYFAVIAAAALAACSGTPEEGPPDAGKPPVTPPCTPLTCESAGISCGSLLDGCGGVLDCGGCDCNVATDCPQRPCETVTACNDGVCAYQPVSCGTHACTCPSGDCEPEDVRACGEGCAEQYCDPAPLLQNGVITFQNVCLPREQVRCGLCDLGNYQCLPAGSEPPVACGDVALTGVLEQTAVCDGGSVNATVLFVDPAFPGNSHTGAREAPFLNLQEALQAAATRGSRAIIIGGNPTLTHPLVLRSGVSVYGGFTGYPLWLPDATRRPTFSVPSSALQSGRLVALVAQDLSLPTEVANIDFVTADLTTPASAQGAMNAGAHLVDADVLKLRDVTFTVGSGQPGGPGADAAAPSGTVPDGPNGQPATHTHCGSAGTVPGGAAVTATCPGQTATATRSGKGGANFKPTSSADNGFVKGDDSTQGALGGLSSFSGTFMLGAGQNGADYASPAAVGAQGMPAVSFTADFPVAQGVGQTGTPGALGQGGGGGSSGHRSEYFNTAVNQSWCRVGGGGGAGGAGGCGGFGGAGGHPGGWSVGLILVKSPGAVLENVAVTVAGGGEGGEGGEGSEGLPGGLGGAGGSQGGNGQAYVGAAGGHGGKGQRGGQGGQGANGRSVGVLCGAGQAPSLSGVSTSGESPPAPSEGCG